MARTPGFTLIELMVVIAIMGIFATMALPQYGFNHSRAKMEEAIGLAETAKAAVQSYYLNNQNFPTDNASAELPNPDKLIGNYVEQITVVEGVVHIQVGNKLGSILSGKVISLQPVVVDGSPESPISWICGYDKAVTGMQAVVENRTDIAKEFLPARCRGI